MASNEGDRFADSLTAQQVPEQSSGPDDPPTLTYNAVALPSLPALSPPPAMPGGAVTSARQLRHSDVVPANTVTHGSAADAESLPVLAVSALRLPKHRYYDPAVLKLLANELERQFELTDLMYLCRHSLEMDPMSVGGTESRGSFVRALVQACVGADAVRALIDVVREERGTVHPTLENAVTEGLVGVPRFDPGDSLAKFILIRGLGADRYCAEYQARSAGEEYRLRVLGYEASSDAERLRRLQRITRRVADLGQERMERQARLVQLEGMYAVTSAFLEGERLTDGMRRTGPVTFDDARKLLRGILQPLSVLHESGIAHGMVTPFNVILTQVDEGIRRVVLTGIGNNWLWGGSLLRVPQNGLPPEVLSGEEPSPASDVYAFAALVYEVITGRPVFEASSAREVAMAHLTREPPSLSSRVSRGDIPAELDELFLRCLHKEPSRRPESAAELLADLQRLGTVSIFPPAALSAEQVEARINALWEAPHDHGHLVSLSSSIHQGADPLQVAEALWSIAHRVDPNDGEECVETRVRLLAEAGRIYLGQVGDVKPARAAYDAILQVRPGDERTIRRMMRIARELGEYEELVELLLQQHDALDDEVSRAQLLHWVGSVYERDLDDVDRAVIAYAQAFCEDPSVAEYSAALERTAGANAQAWEEVLGTCLQVAQSADIDLARRLAVMGKMARWYATRVSRRDLAAFCYQAMLEIEPAHADALTGLADFYRRDGQWLQLVQTLLAGAAAQTTPADEARDKRVEAADVMAKRLGNPVGAADLYERVLAEDMGHEGACQGLVAVLRARGDEVQAARVLTARAESLAGSERLGELCKLADYFEKQGESARAAELYQQVLETDPAHAEALRSLEQALEREGRFQDLLDHLLIRADLAGTTHQRAQLWGRIGQLYEEEFVDYRSALHAYQHALELKPGMADSIAGVERVSRQTRDYLRLADVLSEQLSVIDDHQQFVNCSLVLARVQAEELDDNHSAIATLERAICRLPDSAEALEALATLRARAGLVDEATETLEDLARQAADPAERASHYLAAARVFEQRGYAEEAIERYKLALDVNPAARGVALVLREAYQRNDDYGAVAELIKTELSVTTGAIARAKLQAELARVYLERLGDEHQAEQMALAARELDATNLDARFVLGLTAFRDERLREAASHFDQIIGHIERFEKPLAVEALVAYIKALSLTDRGARAVDIGETLLGWAPGDFRALHAVAEVVFEHGEPQRALELHEQLYERGLEQLTVAERAKALYRYGESARRVHAFELCVSLLERALELEPTSTEITGALAKGLRACKRWREMADVMYRSIDFVDDEKRFELFLHIGDIAVQKLKDLDYAIHVYLLALDERSDDRETLVRLMRVYGEKPDWVNLMSVVLKLARLVDDPKLRAKYLRTAGQVSFKELGNCRRADELLTRALELDPEQAGALKSALELHRRSGNALRLKELLKLEITSASKAQDNARMVRALLELGDLYLNRFRDLEQAVAVFEAALEVNPGDAKVRQFLRDFYTQQSGVYCDKAIAEHQHALDRSPENVESYRALRRLYTEAKRADASWCACQALAAMGQAEPAEQRFFGRLRPEEMAIAQGRLEEGEWPELIMHPKCDVALTGIWVVIRQAIAASLGRPALELGYGESHRIDPRQHSAPLVSCFVYAAEVLNVPLPSVYVYESYSGDARFLPSQPPACVFGQRGLDPNFNMQDAAFVAAQMFTYFLPGPGARAFLSTTAKLKTWLFSAIRASHPKFPIPRQLESEVRRATFVLKATLDPGRLEQLASLVTKLLATHGSLDLKRWCAGVDFTADRLGLIFANDLEVAVRHVRTSTEVPNAVSASERISELMRYSVSESYFQVRARLGLEVD